ncbi:hypothetical protein Bint_1157 [Brachyspira intermedia PWS/A]|uniref:Uncharacterized protein n=1 Tax=Brachyspira intermedia (strain ATCC 51140 / PWS/A) TaxID=1045858 RepID=G0EN19_BRAIP|nr:hypothetical protein [Brachyspira intermedia]AEM21778.1 hypothetical protein Bint_1157 [Brachyspira intermedia PWS/A]
MKKYVFLLVFLISAMTNLLYSAEEQWMVAPYKDEHACTVAINKYSSYEFYVIELSSEIANNIGKLNKELKGQFSELNPSNNKTYTIIYKVPKDNDKYILLIAFGVPAGKIGVPVN